MQARAVALKTRPEGMPTTDNFPIIDIDVTEPQDGEIQVENICMSVDPICVAACMTANPMCRLFKSARR